MSNPPRARETPSTALQIAQELQEQLRSNASALTHGFGSRSAAGSSLPTHDLELLAGSLRGADARTVLTLRKYVRDGCGEREFAAAAESLQRRRRAPDRKPLSSEARYFCSELARLLSERRQVVA